MLGRKSNSVGPYIKVNFPEEQFVATNVIRLIVDGAKVVDAADLTLTMACYLASFHFFNSLFGGDCDVCSI